MTQPAKLHFLQDNINFDACPGDKLTADLYGNVYDINGLDMQAHGAR